MKYLITVFLMLVSLSASAVMTDAQLQTLANSIRSDTDPAVVSALSAGSHIQIATAYNAGTTFVVWKTSVSQDEIMQNGFDWTRVDNLSVGASRVWEWMFDNETRTINPSRPNIRAGIEAVWKGTAADLAVRAAVYAHCKRTATKSERLYATGVGTDANPGLLGWEGPLPVSDVTNALNNF